MSVLTLPHTSRMVVFSCFLAQAIAVAGLAHHPHRNLGIVVMAFFGGGFLTDSISGLFHFSFDYLWPADTPVMGPISVEFKEHHREPTLDPSAILSNFTRGAYGALPLAVITWALNLLWVDSRLSFVTVATIMWMSIWMLGFHQIHSYAHMGSRLNPDDFNRSVAEISRLPSRRQQEKRFSELFETVGLPRVVRLMQRLRLFIRPEVHWRHHIDFECNFSSVNGWSDPLMNLVYGPIARWKKAKTSYDSALVANYLQKSHHPE